MGGVYLGEEKNGRSTHFWPKAAWLYTHTPSRCFWHLSLLLSFLFFQVYSFNIYLFLLSSINLATSNLIWYDLSLMFQRFTRGGSNTPKGMSGIDLPGN